MKNGVTRLVFFVGKYVIKIPNFTHCHLHFLNGCYANCAERNYCKMFNGMPEFLNLVAKSYFCSWFGLIQIQQRVQICTEHIDYDAFENVCSDRKPSNFGTIDGRIVCVDYP